MACGSGIGAGNAISDYPALLVMLVLLALVLLAPTLLVYRCYWLVRIRYQAILLPIRPGSPNGMPYPASLTTAYNK
jgi:hypothetical protein